MERVRCRDNHSVRCRFLQHSADVVISTRAWAEIGQIPINIAVSNIGVHVTRSNDLHVSVSIHTSGMARGVSATPNHGKSNLRHIFLLVFSVVSYQFSVY